MVYLLGCVFTLNVSAKTPLIYSEHWYGSQPTSQKRYSSQEILLVHNLFTASFDLQKKFSRWVAYKLSPHLVWGFLKEKRDFQIDIHLASSYPKNLFLDSKDYKGHTKGALGFKYDRGHLAPLGSFKGSVFAYELQYLSNIVPQNRNLNRQAWRNLETEIRSFVKKGNELRVIAGTLYGSENYGKPYKTPLPPWPKIQGKIQQIPSGFWKMLTFKKAGTIYVCAFIMPQTSKLKTTKKYRVKLQRLEQYTGLSFLKGTTASIKERCHFLN